MKLRIRIPATTTNLGPGFDCLGIALSLYNEIEVDYRNSATWKLNINIRGEGEKSLSRDKGNLIFRVMKSVIDRMHHSPLDIHMVLVNRIPLARGLGSSAAAIIGGLFIANKIIGNRLCTDEILKVAMKFEPHPDNVVPALLGGLCSTCKMEDGRIVYLRWEVHKRTSLVACIPEMEISTDTARKILPENIPFSNAVFSCSRAVLLLGALLNGKYEVLKFAMEDKFHQPYRKKLIPGMYEAIYAANKAGAFGSALSGSGSTVIAFAPRSDRVENRVGKEMQKAFAGKKIRSKYLILGINNKGTVIS